MRYRPARYVCPRCKWDFAKRRKRCCPGCGTLLLIMSDVPTDAELSALKSFWMWNPEKERWDYIRDWEEHKRDAMRKFEEYTKAKGIAREADEVHQPRTPWVQ